MKNLSATKIEDDVNLIKIKDDYFNISTLTDSSYKIMSEFGFRPNVPIRKTNLPFIKVDQEDIENFFYEDKNYELYWDYFPINNKEFSHLSIQQNFINMAIKIPSILYPEVFENNIIKIFNSRNIENTYKKIIKEAGHDLNNIVLVYTKRFHFPDKYGGVKFDESTINEKKCYYVIPQINIYNNYHMLENKFICELTGTIMS